MAPNSPYSPSPSPSLESSHEADSSDEDVLYYIEGMDRGSASRSGTPTEAIGQSANGSITGGGMECLWEECRNTYGDLRSLIMHIHDDHIGVHKSNYTCEWRTCARRGLAQTSRFALISHIRSHTGEKPFVCPLPECDKSFTRSDALAKHTRMQHNIVPPAPGRGGNRKRKREEPEPTVFQGPEGYGTFKLEPPDVHGDYDDRISPPLDLYTNGNGSRRSASPDIDIEDSDPDDGIPPYLSALLDPSTGLIMGRPPAMVKYLVMKAKHQYVLEEHASLIEELRAVRFEERRWREAKDAKLDELLRKLFGAQAEELTLSQPRSAVDHSDGQRLGSEGIES